MKNLKFYEAPTVETTVFAAENGFQASGGVQPFAVGIMDYNDEETLAW